MGWTSFSEQLGTSSFENPWLIMNLIVADSSPSWLGKLFILRRQGLSASDVVVASESSVSAKGLVALMELSLWDDLISPPPPASSSFRHISKARPSDSASFWPVHIEDGALFGGRMLSERSGIQFGDNCCSKDSFWGIFFTLVGEKKTLLLLFDRAKEFRKT